MMRTRLIILVSALWLIAVNGFFFWSRISHSKMVERLFEQIGIR